MKKSRFVKVIAIVLILLTTLVGCEKENNEVIDKNSVHVSHTKKYVTIYTEEQCTLNITIKIETGKNTDFISKEFKLEGNKMRNLSIENFAEGKYNPDAIITGVSYKEVQYTYEELHDKASICTFLIGTAIAIPVTIFILKYSKKSKSTKNS